MNKADFFDSLRPWQQSALEVWTNAAQSGIVEVVTGGGKTRFALAAIKKWRAETPGGTVAILIPTTALQDQWYVNLVSDLSIPVSDISVWPEKPDLGARFHLMVINTARRRLADVAEAAESLFLVADECHRYASEENSNALLVRKSAVLGLTATAERDFDDGLERHLIPQLGPIIFRYTLAQARADGVVSDFNLANVRVPLSEEESADIRRLSRSIAQAASAGDEERVKRLAMRRASISKNAIARIPAAVAIAESLRRRKLIVFHEDIERANLLTELLKARNHRVVAYHSKIGRDMRRDNLRMFKAGLVDVLVCCRALDEGIDVPEADSAILVASTSSHRQRVQRLGRVLRSHPGKGAAEIYTIYATDQEEQRLLAEIARLDDVAQSRWLEMSL